MHPWLCCSLQRVSRRGAGWQADTRRPHWLLHSQFASRGVERRFCWEGWREVLPRGWCSQDGAELPYFPVAWLASPCAVVHGRMSLPLLHYKGSCSSQQIKNEKVAALL